MASPARAIVLVAALSIVPLVSARARAQDGGTVRVADGAVDVRIVGTDDPELRDSIRELLARLHLSLSPAGGASSRVASVQIDLSSRSEALVVVTDGATGEASLRRSVPRDASADIVREEIAHAVQSAVEAALLAARERAAQPAPAAPAPPPPPPPVVAPVAQPSPPSRPVAEEPRAPPHSSPFGIEVATLAGVSPIADSSGLATRIGLGASVNARTLLHPSIALAFLYAVPFGNGDEELSTLTNIASVRGLAGIGVFHGRWLAVDLGVGGGIDVVTVAPHSDELPSSVALNPATRVDRILSAMVTAHAGISSGIILLLSAGVEMDLDSRQYVLADGNAVNPVLAPWQFRPMILAGFGFTALGDGLFPIGTGGGR
jgi:hypothetical protein